MAKGTIHRDPILRYGDEYSKREITRLTDYLGHSNHFYFTDPCWLAAGRSFLFTSDRGNRSNIYRYDLDDYTITQLTDFTERRRPHACWSEANARLYFWDGRRLTELDPARFSERVIYEAPPDMEPGERANPTADGRYVISKLQERLATDDEGITFSYSSFRRLYHARPLTRITRTDVQTGETEIIHEERRYITHLNTSPSLPRIMTFCHEGPWDLVEQRIWGLNVETGESWKIRPQDDGLDLAVGHEYWFADGERIGYHGARRDGTGDHVFGFITWDNRDHVERHFPFRSTHFHSLDESLVVGDGSPAAVFTHQGVAQPFIQLFRWNGTAYEGPRILAYHRSTFNDQHAHPHPRFTPDGGSILYTSDLTAYSNMYLVEIGNFEELPLLDERVQPRHT
ncbi:MAG: oligogalacturonate lyase family protein [Spirochaetales bacterium]|nr:oligogalacturonate lyase family protein [Spirochaetales bacterium]